MALGSRSSGEMDGALLSAALIQVVGLHEEGERAKASKAHCCFIEALDFCTSFARGSNDQKNRSSIVVARWLSASENSPLHR